MICSSCQQEIPDGSEVCPICNAAVALPVEPANPYAATPNPGYQGAPMQGGPSSPEQGDGTGGVIPYKNPKALIAYYLGIVSGLPLIGLPIGIVAFVLGIQGLRARKKNPAIKGSVHAWIGIGCGGIFAIFWGICAVAIIIAIANA